MLDLIAVIAFFWPMLSLAFFRPTKYKRGFIHSEGTKIKERTRSYTNFVALILNIREGIFSEDIKQLKLPERGVKTELDRELDEEKRQLEKLKHELEVKKKLKKVREEREDLLKRNKKLRSRNNIPHLKIEPRVSRYLFDNKSVEFPAPVNPIPPKPISKSGFFKYIKTSDYTKNQIRTAYFNRTNCIWCNSTKTFFKGFAVNMNGEESIKHFCDNCFSKTYKKI